MCKNTKKKNETLILKKLLSHYLGQTHTFSIDAINNFVTICLYDY